MVDDGHQALRAVPDDEARVDLVEGVRKGCAVRALLVEIEGQALEDLLLLHHTGSRTGEGDLEVDLEILATAEGGAGLRKSHWNTAGRQSECCDPRQHNQLSTLTCHGFSPRFVG